MTHKVKYKCVNRLFQCLFYGFSMAVPFVKDWDIVQTLGEGAYGEYDSFILNFTH